jgi:YgiT-type zinc finger domain-containing protein
VAVAYKKRKKDMKKTNIETMPCSECGGRIEKKYISQEFEREGLKVKLSGISALVCSKCGEIYFQPGGADKVAEAANSLFRLARAEKQHKHILTAQICRA